MVKNGPMRHRLWPLGHGSCGPRVSCHCIRWHSFVQIYTACLKAEDVPLFAVFRLAISLCCVLTVSKALHGLAKSALAVQVRLNASLSSVTLRPVATTVPLVASVQVYEGTGWPSDVHVKTLPGWYERLEDVMNTLVGQADTRTQYTHSHFLFRDLWSVVEWWHQWRIQEFGMEEADFPPSLQPSCSFSLPLPSLFPSLLSLPLEVGPLKSS